MILRVDQNITNSSLEASQWSFHWAYTGFPGCHQVATRDFQCEKFEVNIHNLLMFGLSKERPILGDHAKAHIHEIWQISWNPPKNLINQITQQKLFSFMQCSGEGYVSWFTWNPADFKRPIARNGNTYVWRTLTATGVKGYRNRVTCIIQVMRPQGPLMSCTPQVLPSKYCQG